MKKVMVAMSGGVDSSVTAYLLKQQGYECCGCTMKLYDNEDVGISSEKTCCSLSDIEDARSVAVNLGMNYYVFNFKDDFDKCVISKFVNCYECGITPNPCVDCNRYMKFDKLLERARTLGYDYIATGHYARIVFEDGKYKLKKGSDPNKDQSYVLYSLTQEQLAHTLFPVGDMKKEDLRNLAEKQGFINARKHDSQDICFVPDGDYASMIERYTGKKYEPGKFVDKNGNIIGEHKGIIHYTIGQRKGLGIAAEHPLYVCDICTDSNTVVLGKNEDLFRTHVSVSDFHWIDGGEPPVEFRCKAKLRYRHTEQPATVHYEGDGKILIVFDEKQRAVTPGQIAVLYDEDTVLGGGIVTGSPVL